MNLYVDENLTSRPECQINFLYFLLRETNAANRCNNSAGKQKYSYSYIFMGKFRI